MNQLSWLLYMGNVFGNIGPLLVIFGVISFFVAAGCWLAFITDEGPLDKPTAPIVFTFVAMLFFIMSSFCPDKDTVYAIAASQMGEQALKTPLAGKAEKALESWLDKQVQVNTAK